MDYVVGWKCIGNVYVYCIVELYFDVFLFECRTFRIEIMIANYRSE